MGNVRHSQGSCWVCMLSELHVRTSDLAQEVRLRPVTSRPRCGLVSCLLVVLRARVKGTRLKKGFPALSGITSLLPVTQFYGLFFVASWRRSDF